METSNPTGTPTTSTTPAAATPSRPTPAPVTASTTPDNTPILEPTPLSPEEGMKRAQAACSVVETACMQALEGLDVDGGYHEEVACARGQIRTVLQLLRAGWPGGKKVVAE